MNEWDKNNTVSNIFLATFDTVLGYYLNSLFLVFDFNYLFRYCDLNFYFYYNFKYM